MTERGYPVAEVSQRLGVSKHSLYEWRKTFSQPVSSSGEDGQSAEIRRLKRELVRVTEERDISKKRPLDYRQGCKVKYAFVAEHRPIFSIRAISNPARIAFRNPMVPLPLGPAKRVLCLVEGSVEQASPGRPSADRTHSLGLERQLQGLWLSQDP